MCDIEEKTGLRYGGEICECDPLQCYSTEYDDVRHYCIDMCIALSCSQSVSLLYVPNLTWVQRFVHNQYRLLKKLITYTMYMYAFRVFVSNSNSCALFRYVCTQGICKVIRLYVMCAVDVNV